MSYIVKGNPEIGRRMLIFSLTPVERYYLLSVVYKIYDNTSYISHCLPRTTVFIPFRLVQKRGTTISKIYQTVLLSVNQGIEMIVNRVRLIDILHDRVSMLYSCFDIAFND